MFSEYLVYIGTVAIELVCEPSDRTFLAVKFCFYHLTDVYHSAVYKKGGTIRNLFSSEAPPSTMYTNKHEQSTPNSVNLHLLILVYFKLAVFRRENKSQSSISLICIRMETLSLSSNKNFLCCKYTKCFVSP